MQENELRKILGASLEPNRIIDARIEDAYQKIRAAQVTPGHGRSPLVRRILIGMGSVAAVFALMVTLCVMHPVLT